MPLLFLGLAMCSYVVVIAPIRHGDVCDGNVFPWTHPHLVWFLDIFTYQTLHNHNSDLGTRLCTGHVIHYVYSCHYEYHKLSEPIIGWQGYRVTLFLNYRVFSGRILEIINQSRDQYIKLLLIIMHTLL